MIVTSKVTGKSYDTDRVLYITFISQIAFYFKMGCDDDVLDIIWDSSRNQKRPLCVVYRKSPRIRELYKLWKQRGATDENEV